MDVREIMDKVEKQREMADTYLHLATYLGENFLPIDIEEEVRVVVIGEETVTVDTIKAVIAELEQRVDDIEASEQKLMQIKVKADDKKQK